MSRFASMLFGVAIVTMAFALGFAGSGVAPSPPTHTAAEARVSGGGSDFWHLEPVDAPEGELGPSGVCRPLTRSGPPCAEPAPGRLVGAMAGVDRWRPLVARHFQPGDVDRALQIIRCESNGDPQAANPVSTARGLFQHLGSAWGKRSADAGFGGADIYDPEANVAVAAWLVYHGGGWTHWNASGHCW